MVQTDLFGTSSIKRKVFERTLYNPVSFFKNERKGDYVNRIINDVGVYASNRLISDAMLITNISTLIIGFVYICIINIYISIFIMAICVVYFASYLVVNKKMRECAQEEKETNSKLFHTTEQMYSFSKTAKYFNKEHYFSQKYYELVQSLCEKSINLQKWKSLAGASSTALVQMIPIFAVMFGIYFISIGKCTVGALFSIYSLASVFDNPIRNLTDFNLGFQQARVSKNRVEELFIGSEADAVNKKLREIELLECKDLEYRHKDSKKIIEYENIRLSRTSRIAIVGESGVGKSTLIRIIMREIKPQSGKILVNDTGYDSFSLESYYDKIAVQEQDIILYDDSVKNNIMLGRNAIKEEFEEIVSMLGLNDCMDKRPDQLSGGEKKRVGLARALIGKPEVLLLDEPTDGIDDNMENKIIDYLDEYLSNNNIALLVITHKMAITKICDRVIHVTSKTIEIA